jgi:hypothetical protein
MSLDEEVKSPSIIYLNVGGTKFMTTKQTLTSQGENFFSSMFSGKFPIIQESDGTIFIDRDAKYFSYILNFLRDPRWTPETSALGKREVQELLLEAEYYQIDGLIKVLVEDISRYELTYVHITAKCNNIPWYQMNETKKMNFKLFSMFKGDTIDNYIFVSEKPSLEWYKVKHLYHVSNESNKQLQKDHNVWRITY